MADYKSIVTFLPTVISPSYLFHLILCNVAPLPCRVHMMFFRYTSVQATERLGTDGPEGVGETRPCVLCEYSHAMGNSNGNLHKYWEVNSPSAHESWIRSSQTACCIPPAPIFMFPGWTYGVSFVRQFAQCTNRLLSMSSQLFCVLHVADISQASTAAGRLHLGLG